MSTLSIAGPPVRGRSCGNCRACCIQVPVDLPMGKKPANVKCPMLRSSGCSIYARRPNPCRVWSCRWLFDEDTAELRRPDISGVIVDPVVDTVFADDKPEAVLQVWCDPNRRDAHRDPALRAYLAKMFERHGLATIVRWNSREAIILVPPAAGSGGEWLELPGTLRDEAEHVAALAEAGISSRFLGQ